VDATIEREEWLILLTMIGDIRAELEDLNRLLRGDDDEETQDEP
jgi:hypothetical protein